MAPLWAFLVGLIVAVPIGWILSEFRAGSAPRTAFAVFAIAATTFFFCCLICLIHFFILMDYNQTFGYATEDLIESSLKEIEDGHLDRVLKAWRGLNNQYHPTYEGHHPEYPALVNEAVARIRGETPIAPDSRWNVPVLGRQTWVGHWEDDTGYWIVISDYGRLEIVRSGTLALMESVSVSDDFRVLKFKEDGHWLHTLTLKNKYEAIHEWFDLDNQAVSRAEPMNKLKKATEEEKQMTQQHALAQGTLQR